MIDYWILMKRDDNLCFLDDIKTLGRKPIRLLKDCAVGSFQYKDAIFPA